MNKFRTNETIEAYNTEHLNAFELFILSWKRYFDFEGVSTRREYWLTYVVYLLIALAFTVMTEILFFYAIGDILAILYAGYAIAAVIPQLSIMVRRLHDTGVSGWNYLWFLTIIGGIYVIYLLARASR
jgi:uncharacterized membrane protein YhaH (DUF805 family)